MATRIDGKALAESIYEELRKEPAPARFLAGIVSGDDPAAESFQKIKEAAAKKLGIDYRIYVADEPANNDAWRRMVRDIAKHSSCGGIVVQLPLPKHLNTQYICNAIPFEKDPDVLSARPSASASHTVLSPAVETLRTILDTQDVDLANSTVAVIGIGKLVGQPIADYLKSRAKEVPLLDIGFDTAELKRADLVISGTGVFDLQPSMLRDGAGVIDFGYRSEHQTLRGDLDTSSEDGLSHLGFYTPTPGGTGPLLVAHLLRNFYLLN